MTSDLLLHQEMCGSGPVILLVPPTPGDCGQYAALAGALAGFTVVTYDRRGTSRSPRPSGWSATSVAEQADDAAAVLARVTSQPALVYGTSNGAMVALELALRHPERVSAVLLHEMPLVSVLADPEPVVGMLRELVGVAMQRGGPVAALDAFLRFAYGDALVERIEPALRARMDANAEMVFSIELPAFQAYRPDEDALGSVAVPVRPLVGEGQALPMFSEVATWLAERVGGPILATPGGHGVHWSHPADLAAFISERAPPRLPPA